MGKKKPVTEKRAISQFLNVNLRPFFVVGLFALLFVTPLMRGLFFAPEMLLACLAAGGIFLFCLYDQVLRRELFLPRILLDWAVLALVLAYALSLITAVHMRTALGEFMEVAACAMLYICAVRAVRHEKNLDLLLMVCYASACTVAVIGILAALGIFPFPGAYANGVIMSTLQYKNALAVYLVLFNVVGLGLSVKDERLWPKLLYALGNCILLLVILGTQSRGGWLIYPLAVCGFIALLPAVYRWRAAYHLMIALGCALAASRGFYEALRAGGDASAGLFVLYGALAAVTLQVAYHFLARWLNRDVVTDATRRLVAIGGVSYFALVAAFYIYASAGATPVAGAQVVPVEVAARAQTVTAADPSFQQRLDYARDALRIVSDYPLTGAGGGGWNALYHQYQSSLYWSTETHNHFFQTWVEAGTTGFLALLALWAGFITLIVRFWRRAPRDSLWVSITAAGVGVLVLSLHSAFDFDLSLPALAMLLFVLCGSLRAVTPTGQKSDIGGEKSAAPSREKRHYRLVAIAALGTVAALALILSARNLYAAGTLGAAGAKALAAGELAAAKDYYTEARRLDPFTAAYAADLAQIYAVESLAQDDAIKHYQALALAREAARAEPYNAQVRAVLVNLYLLLREPALAVREAEALLEANPMLVSSYEAVAAARVEAARYYLRLGKEKEARPFLEPLTALTEEMEERGVRPTARLELSLGQLEAVAGRHAQAIEHLEAALRDKKTGAEAAAWLAVVSARAGDSAAAREAVRRVEQKGAEALKLYEALRKESQSWPNRQPR
ncbi:MAG TPA: polymerase [Desulfotomaculum sp.]|nr:polymerase [Desulfotomaculum sp.]